MTRAILGLLVVSLLAAHQASAQQRPSLAKQALEQARIKNAICAKADADGDSYRPFVCTPRCDCLAPLLMQFTPSSCQESSAGVFDIQLLGPPGTCDAGFCSNSPTGPSLCHTGTSPCPSGTQCVTSCFATICFSSCLTPCASNAGCPAVVAGFAQLSGVSPPDSPNVVECLGNTAVTKINSNDALECLDQVEASTGPCQ